MTNDMNNQTVPGEADVIGGFPDKSDSCAGCGKPLLLANAWMTDGCPCNSPLGVNSMNETRWRLLMQLQQEQARKIEELSKAPPSPAADVDGVLERIDRAKKALSHAGKARYALDQAMRRLQPGNVAHFMGEGKALLDEISDALLELNRIYYETEEERAALSGQESKPSEREVALVEAARWVLQSLDSRMGERTLQSAAQWGGTSFDEREDLRAALEAFGGVE